MKPPSLRNFSSRSRTHRVICPRFVINERTFDTSRAAYSFNVSLLNCCPITLVVFCRGSTRTCCCTSLRVAFNTVQYPNVPPHSVLSPLLYGIHTTTMKDEIHFSNSDEGDPDHTPMSTIVPANHVDVLNTTILSFKGHGGSIRAIEEIVPQGAFAQGILVTCSWDNSVKTWSIREGCLNTFGVHKSSIYDFSVLDHQTILTVSWDKSCKVLRIGDGKVLASRSFPDYLYASAALGGGKSAIIADEKGLFKVVWNDKELNVTKQVDLAHEDQVQRIYARTEKFATCSRDGTAKLWDATSLAHIHTFTGHSEWVNSVSFDETYFVTGSQDTTIRVYDVNTFKHLATIKTHSDRVNCVRVVKGANMVISGGGDQILALHALPSGECLCKYNMGMSINSISVLSSGKQAAVAGWKPDEVKLIEIDALPIPRYAALHHFRAAAAARGGRKALTLALATQALNATLRKIGAEMHVSVEKFEQRFMEVSMDIEVSEDKFLEVFRGVMKDGVGEDRLAKEYTAAFQKYMEGRESASVPFASRVLCHACKDMKKRGLLGDRAMVSEETVRQRMSKFDRFNPGHIALDEFVEAALYIVHGVDRKRISGERLTRKSSKNLSNFSLSSRVLTGMRGRRVSKLNSQDRPHDFGSLSGSALLGGKHRYPY